MFTDFPVLISFVLVFVCFFIYFSSIHLVKNKSIQTLANRPELVRRGIENRLWANQVKDPQSKEIWEADLEEDDILVLQDVFMMTKPLDAEEAEAAAALAQREKDAVLHELRLEMSKLFSKVEKYLSYCVTLSKSYQFLLNPRLLRLQNI